MTLTTQYPEPTEAIERFRSLLAQRTWPTRVAWLCTAGVTTRGRLIFVDRTRLLAPAEIETQYRRSAERSLGVLLSALGRDSDTSYCYLWAPTDKVDAEYALMPSALKLSIRTDPAPVVPVGHARFLWHRLWGPRGSVTSELLVA